MSWNDAVDRYGEGVLPSEGQCRAMGRNKDKINNAMRAFGGTVMDDIYWGKEDDSSYAWFVNMNGGFVLTIGTKGDTNRVRAVAPFPAASAR